MDKVKATLFNPLFHDALVALAIAGAAFALLVFLKAFVFRRLSAFAADTPTDVDDLLTALFQRIARPYLLILAVYLGAMTLELPATIDRALGRLLVVGSMIQAALLGSRLLVYWTDRYRDAKTGADATQQTTVAALGFIARIALWSILALLMLENIGVDVSALIAGLGIGGIAVALAVQNVLGDLLASLSIYFDRPFSIGDFVVVDKHMGTIEAIGLKTTRIRSLSGEQLILANSDLLKSRIHNYKRMRERRVVVGVGVVFSTSAEQLAAIPQMIREIVTAQTPVRFDRAHLKEFGSFSINFEIVYWVLSPDHGLHMDIQQAVLLAIFRRFQQAGIALAYPTQTIHVQAGPTPEGRELARSAEEALT